MEISATSYVRDGYNVVQEKITDVVHNTISVRSYVWDNVSPGGIGGLLEATVDGVHYYYCYDGKGNVAGLINDAGEWVARYRYNAFGNLVAQSGTFDQPYMFSTKRFYAGFGVYDYGYRFYQPIIGRWLTRDPIGEEGGVNLYGFVGNSPMNAVDPLGLTRDPMDIYNDAVAITTAMFPNVNDHHNGPGDAFRHCLASCEMTRERGCITAWAFGWGNEKDGDWNRNQ